MPWWWVNTKHSIHWVEQPPNVQSVPSFSWIHVDSSMYCHISAYLQTDQLQPDWSLWLLNSECNACHSHNSKFTNWWIESHYSSYLPIDHVPIHHLPIDCLLIDCLQTDHFQVLLWFHLTMASWYTSKLAGSWPPTASPRMLNCSLQVHHWVNCGSSSISILSQFYPPSGSLSSLDHHL